MVVRDFGEKPPRSDTRNGPSGRVRAYLGLGSNQGNLTENLRAARESLALLPGVHFSTVSSIYLTDPQGMRQQPFFANQVAAVDCCSTLHPERLLDMLLALESSLGRDRCTEQRFGPRRIDLDLLLFGNEDMKSQRLILPHPRMLERAFVLVPLAEVAPDLLLPQGMSVIQALERLDYARVGNVICQAGSCKPGSSRSG